MILTSKKTYEKKPTIFNSNYKYKINATNLHRENKFNWRINNLKDMLLDWVNIVVISGVIEIYVTMIKMSTSFKIQQTR